MFKADVKFHFFGWYSDGDKSDKVWGWLTVDSKIYNFWGRRGADGPKTLKFKRFPDYSQYDVQTVSRAKMRKGYRNIPLDLDSDGVLVEVEKIYPGFSEHVRNQLMYARITGTVRRETV